MQTIVLPKNLRKRDFFLASMAYIAGSELEMESKDNPSNLRNKEVVSAIKENFSDDATKIIDMHMRYNVCDAIICSNVSVMEKIRKISLGITTCFEQNSVSVL